MNTTPFFKLQLYSGYTQIIKLTFLLAIFLSSCFCQDKHPVSADVDVEENVEIPKDKTISYVNSALGLLDLVSADLEIAKILLQNVHKLHFNSYLRKASEIYLEDLYSASGINVHHNHTESQVNPHRIATAKNPIGTYRTIRRLVKLLPDLMFHSKQVGIFDIPGTEASRFLRKGLPDQTDLNDAMDVILRTIEMYMLNIKLFASGNISGLITGAKLDAVHCYEIGVYGSNSGDFNSQGVDWLELALNSVTIDGDKTINKGTASIAFHQAVIKHDKEFVDDDEDQSYSMSFTEQIEFMMKNRNFSSRQTKPLRDYKMYMKGEEKNDSEYNYISLCSGQNLQSPEIQSKLFCWFESHAHERFLIGPLKMEFLSRNPDIVQIYDILGENMISKIRSVSDVEMAPAVVLDVSDFEGDYIKPTVKKYRVSESAWLSDPAGEFHPVSKLITHVTGLETITRGYYEFLQVGSYTPAGHYGPHADSELPLGNQNGAGDRIATFMVYMSDVELGGYTAFPHLGVAAKPVKGSAIFWYNIHRSEESDNFLFHGGCPVAIGQKHVVTKWIRYRDQFLTHKCSLNPQDRYHVAVNKKYPRQPLAFGHTFQYTPLSTDLKQQLIESHEDVQAKYSIVTENRTNSPETLLTKYSYRSALGLKALAETEGKIYNTMKLAYMKVNRNITTIAMEIDENFEESHLCVGTYLKDFEESTGRLISISTEEGGALNDFQDSLSPSRDVAWNPIAAYRMIWRSQTFLQKWVSTKHGNKYVLGRYYQKAIKAVQKIYKESDGPDASDLVEAKLALMKIQYVYDLKANDMASGTVAKTPAHVSLSALQCYEIGLEGVAQKMYTMGYEWLQAAAFKARFRFSADNSISLDKIDDALRNARQAHDEAHILSEGWEPTFYLERFNSSDNDESSSVRRLTRRKIQYQAFRFKQESNFAEINYNGVCSGKPHQTPEEKSKLFCWYEHKIHPYWEINPIKAEFFSMHPKIEIVQYYDLLSDRAMKGIEDFATKKLVKSTTNIISSDSLHTEERKLEPKIRSSATAWMNETETEDAGKVYKLIERVTGLTVQNNPFDQLQISTYSPGAHYNVHMDVDGESKHENIGSRLATFFFYFSDVQTGGYTAFSQAGAKVVPKKGSAVFWYNLDSSGKPKEDTWHGACPVIFGEKWVCNMWIAYNNQKNHMCQATHLKGSDEILVNRKSKY